MNRIAFSSVLVGLGAVIGLFVSSGLAEQAAVVRGTDADKLTALRKERRDALSDAVKSAKDAYNNGVRDYAPFQRMTISLMNAELDLVPDRAGRVVVRKQIVEQFKAIEKTVAERVNSLVADSTDLLEARAARLQAEIDLLLEMSDGK